jgi:hypothetical protein
MSELTELMDLYDEMERDKLIAVMESMLAEHAALKDRVAHLEEESDARG